MENKQSGSLPVRGSLGPAYVVSLLTAALAAFVSVTGILDADLCLSNR
jgi:hypothetical protein